MPASQ
jgi:NADH dehydrogenase [ubiquinone] 1 alpha subcomplex assembly factor 6